MAAVWEIRHAGLIALRLSGAWTGALIEGPSGSGKSELALHALAEGFRLVADDRTVVLVSAGALYGRAPPALAGLIEQRGLGIVRTTAINVARVSLRVRCEGGATSIERMPEFKRDHILGIDIPTLDLYPFEASAPAKLRRALEHLGCEAGRGYQGPRAPLV